MNDHLDKNDVNDGVIHEYDGIKECDNQLPRWWLYTLYATVAFAGVYWFAFDVFHFAESPRETFERESEVDRAREIQKMRAAGVINDESLSLLARDKGTLATGADAFVKTCAPCHKETGGGGIGPNLTDEYWLHGNSPSSIWKTVKDGVPAKGMPAWGEQLGFEKTQAVVAYVMTLRNTNAPGGKAPQGEKAQ